MYESSDGGNTIYRREFGDYDTSREKVTKEDWQKDVDDKYSSTNEGETCMHGNSWHSECMECNSESLIDDIFSLVREYSNDFELGAKMRELYNSYTTTNSDNFDKDRKRWGG